VPAENFPGWSNGENKTKNSTIKPTSTLTVLCMKIQGATAPPLPTPMYTATNACCRLIARIRKHLQVKHLQPTNYIAERLRCVFDLLKEFQQYTQIFRKRRV